MRCTIVGLNNSRSNTGFQFCNFHSVVLAHAPLDLVEHGFYRGERAFMHAVVYCTGYRLIEDRERMPNRHAID